MGLAWANSPVFWTGPAGTIHLATFNVLCVSFELGNRVGVECPRRYNEFFNSSSIMFRAFGFDVPNSTTMFHGLGLGLGSDVPKIMMIS